MYREIGYKLRDVNDTLINYIRNEDIILEEEGKNIRVKVVMDTPDSVISSKTYPSIFINASFGGTIPKSWRRSEEAITYIDETNNAVVITEQSKIVNYFNSYQIGFMVEYSEHKDIMIEKFLGLFPLEFHLPFVDSDGDDYSFNFLNDGKVIPLDFEKEGRKIFRRDIVLTIRLPFKYDNLIEEVASFGGVEIEQIPI